jgi:hypothetical protein
LYKSTRVERGTVGKETGAGAGTGGGLGGSDGPKRLGRTLREFITFKTGGDFTTGVRAGLVGSGTDDTAQTGIGTSPNVAEDGPKRPGSTLREFITFKTGGDSTTGVRAGLVGSGTDESAQTGMGTSPDVAEPAGSVIGVCVSCSERVVCSPTRPGPSTAEGLKTSTALLAS